MDRWNDELESLFRSYKAALPDPDASANFMPELWQKIEARHSLLIRLKKLTQVFVAAAAALCLLFGMVLAVPRAGNGDLAGSYVDTEKKEVERIREEHRAKVRALLTPEQLPKYEQLRQEREQRMKANKK